jgi:hypothetical protein
LDGFVLFQLSFQKYHDHHHYHFHHYLLMVLTRRRKSQKIASVPVEFKQRIHRLLIILIISGDIPLNPGPVKNPCGLCAKPVAKNHSCLQLQLCGTTFRTISELKTVSTTLKV